MSVRESWSGRYSARYQDASGMVETVVHNDGRRRSMTVRDVEFTGTDFDQLEPPSGLDSATRDSFTFALGALAGFVLEWDMPLGMTIREHETEARLQARLDYEVASPNRSASHETLHLALHWGEGTVASRGVSGGLFELELNDIQGQLPANASLRCCLTCTYSDYHPIGNGLFGDLACFRDNKEAYLKVRGKADFWPVWPTMTEFVQETFVCSEFARRVPGTGYRG